MSDFTVSLIIVSCFISIYSFANVIYNLYLHPLARFPGPFLARASALWRLKHGVQGMLHRSVTEMHRRYGEVVRVSPNELSFCTIESLKDIYGHPQPGQSGMIKSEFYEMYGSGFNSWCIGSERNPEEHKRMKATLSVAFSAKSLSEQEYIVTAMVDEFIRKVGDRGRNANGVDITKWLEMVAFDVMGEMAFGESYHCIDDEKSHFWTQLILDHLFFVTLADCFRHFFLLGRIMKLFSPIVNISRAKHKAYTKEKVTRRLENTCGRKDFFTNLVKKVDIGEINKEEMMAHASTFVIAGGESVASVMTGIVFHLIKPASRAVYEKLCREVRTHYKHYEDINWQTAQNLPYLQAVIKEGLRIFPPGHGLPRLSPGRSVGPYYVPCGAEVYTSPWAVHHNDKYFVRPLSFEPERWLRAHHENGDAQQTSPPYTDVLEASQPFLVGPRACLGRNFAMMEISQIVAKLVWKYDMELVDEHLDFMDMVRIHLMWWKPKCYVRLKEINGSRTKVTLDDSQDTSFRG